MLNAIEFGTFYFFLGKSTPYPLTATLSHPIISSDNPLTLTAFCVFLGVWVFFFVPETKGVRIEEMDKLFGGNQGEEDMQRIADIRSQLGITGGGDVISEKTRHDVSTDQVELA